jgi:hypothetical protein
MSIGEVWLGTLGQDSKLKLVKKITEKTAAKKIVWQKTANGAMANLPGKLSMNFVEATSGSALFGPRWVIFIVRDEAGKEILKVENNQYTAVPGAGEQPLSNLLVLIGGDPVLGAVNELYNLVQIDKVKGGIDRAIELLDSI